MQEQSPKNNKAPEEKPTTLPAVPAVRDAALPSLDVDDPTITALEREGQLYAQGSSPEQAARDEYTPKFPEQRIDEITRTLHELATIVPHVTFDCYTRDPEEFGQALERAEALLESIEDQLAAFEIVIEIENPRVSWISRAIIGVRLLLRGSVNESRLLQALQSNARRDSMLQGVKQLRAIARSNAEKIVRVRAQMKEHEDVQLMAIYHPLAGADQLLQQLQAKGRKMRLDFRTLEATSGFLDHFTTISALYKQYLGREAKEGIGIRTMAAPLKELRAYLQQELDNNAAQQQERSEALMAQARKRFAEKDTRHQS